jgi:GMP synthase (glutamine-hydrolysing)
MIVIVDFGSQTTHLISRRIKELGINTHITLSQKAIVEIRKLKPSGIVLSGGPFSVYEKGAPTIDEKIYTLGIPMLGICYGFQLAAQQLGGKVISGRKEYGPATLEIKNTDSPLLKGVAKHSTIWMSHGDEIVEIPKSFQLSGSTSHVPFAAAEDTKRKLFMIQFHPEVEHTQFGDLILRNFIAQCGEKITQHILKPLEIEEFIRSTVEEAYVIGAVSGGVDSTVAGILTAQAIGKRFIPVYVDNGLMRVGTTDHVKKIFTGIAGINPIVVDAVGDMMMRLRNVSDPETKRKIIGKHYIEVFEQEMTKLIASGKNVTFLLQGTIYSDVIESKGTKHAAKIKSHHNVGGLPKEMKLKLLEPLRNFYKDEVRKIGSLIGLPNEFVHKQVFPGPGYAIRIRGEVTPERLEKEKQADAIILEELGKAHWLEKVYMSFPIMTGASSTAVKGDGRFFGEVIAVRVVQSKDVMTSNWAQLPYEVLQKISSRIVNEVSGISRVVYDITTKPPATMEWE